MSKPGEWHKKKLREIVDKHGMPSEEEMGRQMDELVRLGDMEVAGTNAAGETTYRLTPQGIARARGIAGDFTD